MNHFQANNDVRFPIYAINEARGYIFGASIYECVI